MAGPGFKSGREAAKVVSGVFDSHTSPPMRSADRKFGIRNSECGIRDGGRGINLFLFDVTKMFVARQSLYTGRGQFS